MDIRTLLLVSAGITLACCYTQQRFDGYYNNLVRPSSGSAGKPLMQNISTAYVDYTYKLSGQTRPSTRLISQNLFRTPVGLTLPPSHRNHTAMFAFFGQVVALELTDTDDTTCPVELLNIPVPRCDPDFDPDCTGSQQLPYERIAYDKNTGQSPNSPRKQVNKATSYIDASFVYGSSMVRALHLQALNSARLASGDAWSKYPATNKEGLPFVTVPDPVDHKFHDVNEFWKLGDKHIQESPALLSFGILFFRWHNHLADRFRSPYIHPDDTYAKTRRWLIASLQNIIAYEWLPKLLGESLPEYKGYKSDIYPDVSAVFDGAAIRYILTLIPAGIHQRGASCQDSQKNGPKDIRLCNAYWRSQDLLLQRESALEETLAGLTSQLAEAEDTYVVPDLQSKHYGPLHYSRNDAVAQAIMRGRDYGLPDYNTVRQQMGLPKVKDWADINPWMNTTNPELLRNLSTVYRDIDDVDVFVGGMFETTPQGPGQLFKAIIIDQFVRIRDGDRYWFENRQNEFLNFTEDDIDDIRAITLHDVIANATHLEYNNMQQDVFTWTTDDGPCSAPTHLTPDMMEPCTPHKGYDYFAGTEVAYVIIWISFGLIPFLCLLVAYVLSRCKKWQYMRNAKVVQRNIKDSIGDQLGGSLSQYKGTEWMGDDDSRLVVVRLRQDCTVDVVSLKAKHLRTINLASMNVVHVLLSSNKKRNVLLIRVPKEYDLVLQFSNENQRRHFRDSLAALVAEGEGTMDCREVKLKHLHSKALTRTKRNQLLEKFFKTVFAEAFQMEYDPLLEKDDVETRHARDILAIELTKEEFASALAVKPETDFVENMFALMDSDHNGYISFREFLNAIVMLSKGSGQDKLQTLFRMFDVDGKGTLDRAELLKLFSSLLEMANSNLCKQDMENLVESMCQQNGITSRDAINFDQFCSILSPHLDKIWNSGLEWKGVKNIFTSGEDKKRSAEAKKRTGGHSDMAPQTGNSSNSSSSNNLFADGSEKRHRFVAIRETYSPVKAKIQRLRHFVENNRQHIFYLVIFFGICIGLFAERFYFYTVEREHSGLRAMMSYGISATRGAAAAMSFTFSLLLLTMLRNTITFLRGTFLNLYVPFDSIVSFHKVVAWAALFFTGYIFFLLAAVHVFGYSVNIYQLATQPTKYLCVFDSIVFRADVLPTMYFWFFGNMTGFTGILLVVAICIVYVFATQISRRLIFNAFWLSHKLIVVIYILTILHGASMIVQKPLFHIYFVVPAVLFAIDKIISLSRKRVEIGIVRAENLTSDVTFIEFKRPPRFEYKSGQWVRLACSALGPNEYHPLTLTSAPHEDTLSVYVRAVGPWTHGLRNLFAQDSIKECPYPKLFLDGPYGAGQQDWYQYDVSVLVGAGIGVTPYASILKDFVHMASIKQSYKIRCQKLYFIWVTGSQRHFEWLLDILQEVEDIDQKGIVSTDIFITQFFQNFDLRTAMLYICEEHFQKLSGGRSVFTTLKAATHFGRPRLPDMFRTVHKTYPLVRKVGVFSCGPQGMTKSVERACVDASRTTRALFEHHYENF